MFRLEKIFQQDDFVFINVSFFLKSIVVFFSIYIFSILEFNSIFDLFDYEIYKNSEYFFISIYFPIFYFLVLFIFRVTKKRYLTNFLSFLLNDIIPFFITIPLGLYLFFILKINFVLDINTLYLLVLILCNLFIFGKSLDFFYNFLMNNNFIQRNIMLVGSIENIHKILNEKKDKINIYKCCLIKDDNITMLKEARTLLKIPVFTKETEIKIILEYHELGQIWILDDGEKNTINYFLDLVIKFAVDIIIINFKVNLNDKFNLLSDNLINNKYTYSNYQTSKFFGLNLFTKLLLDKILSILFLLILSPIFILGMIFILIEDGFPIFFSEQSIGWDGRRFDVYKLRTFKKDKSNLDFNKSTNDKEYLKIGKIIKRLHIDEIPQFFNILKGNMSIVGPRPLLPDDNLLYSEVFKDFLKRNKASPGLTGWAQVNGFRGNKPSNVLMKKRMEYDMWYMNNWSTWLDLFIILKTCYIVFTNPKK